MCVTTDKTTIKKTNKPDDVVWYVCIFFLVVEKQSYILIMFNWIIHFLRLLKTVYWHICRLSLCSKLNCIFWIIWRLERPHRCFHSRKEYITHIISDYVLFLCKRMWDWFSFVAQAGLYTLFTLLRLLLSVAWDSSYRVDAWTLCASSTEYCSFFCLISDEFVWTPTERHNIDKFELKSK